MIKKEVVIIGGGPSGLCAAIEAAKKGAKVLVVDENLRAGGQLFKQIHKFFGSSAHRAGIRGIDIACELLEEARKCGIEVWLNSVAIGLFENNKLAIAKNENGVKRTIIIKAEKLLIATGGAENAINFSGWTLPGVMGAGAAQTMVNVNRVTPGEKVLMIGSGNVGLIVSYQLMQAGVEVVGIVEGMDKIGGYAVHASKVKRAGVPFYLGHTIVEAKAKDGEVCSAVIGKIDNKWNVIKGTEKEFEVDTICIAAGLRPLSELARMSGLKHSFIPALGGWVPLHDENMESTIPGIYVAGDTAGVEEANTAMDEGRLAGVAMAESLGYLNREEANKAKEEIRTRLESLRLGPFGEKRFKAKQDIIARRVAL